MKKNLIILNILIVFSIVFFLMGCIDENTIDTDNDGIPDKSEQKGWQITIYNINGTISNKIIYSDHEKTDTDGDGLTDYEEMNRLTDPSISDTDSDGIDDNEESSYGSSPIHFDSWILNISGENTRVIAEYSQMGNLATQYDSDFDGLTDAEEYLKGSDPSTKDTDGDEDWDYIDPDPLWNLQARIILESFTLTQNMDISGGADLYFVILIGDEALIQEEIWDVSLNQEEQLNAEYIVDFPDRNAYDMNTLNIRIAAYDDDNLSDDQTIGIYGSSEEYLIEYDVTSTELTDYSISGDEGNLEFSIQILRT